MGKTFKVSIQGIGDETLTDNEFIAQGGEGTIYAKNGTGFKIYHDPKRMIPFAKIQELSHLTMPNIIKPDRLVMDSKNKVIGHTMRFVKQGEPLCRLFTKAYRKRENITPDMMLDLVKRLQEIVSHVHDKNILIVDLNELNFLASKNFKELYAIDVNCYQTPSFPATAIMDSIRDWHCNGKWSTLTDWYSWGVLACQMLVGIHPYKGGHPKYDGLPIDEAYIKRMKDNCSIFNAQARIPGCCYPFTVIPNGLKQWFEAIFEKGKREMPPLDFSGGVVIAPVMKTVTSGSLFDIREIFSMKEDIQDILYSSGNRLVISKNSISYNGRNTTIPGIGHKFGFTPKLNRPYAAYIEDGMVKLWNIVDTVPIDLSCGGDELMNYGNRVYVRKNTSIMEIKFIEATSTLASISTVGKVLDIPGATKIFDGVIIQNLLGKWYASIFPESGKCYQIKLDELDGYKVMDAKYDNGVMMVIGVRKNGKYVRFVFRFKDGYDTHDSRCVELKQYVGLNFTVGEQGTCVCITENDEVEVISNKYGHSSVTVLKDNAIDGDMTLYHDGTSIVVVKGTKVYNIKMKKS